MVKEGAMDEIGKEIAYDLRQVYAIEILGEHLKDIARARKSDNFPMYFKCLKDVYIVVQHKFKKDKKKKDAKNPKEEYKELMDAVVKLANEYPDVWLKKSNDIKHYALIEQALNQVEMFLYNKIEDAKIFGASRDIPGL
jgi:hypothetical protein|tara:strand:+ start:388 stop:804 length:417 start_codon:yes stop_codon:yes gene_type:complete